MDVFRLARLFLFCRGAPSTVRNFMTSSGCSMKGALPRKARVPTVLGVRERKLNPNFFFLKLFGHLRDIPAKSRDIPAKKKCDFPGFEGHTELFGPHVEHPYPNAKYPDSKVWVWVLFSCLRGSTILKLIWGGNLLYFPGFRDLQPYETWKFRICSESVSGVFPDLFRISLQKC